MGQCGASGFSSDAQMHIHRKLIRKIEKGTLGLQPPEPLEPREPNSFWGRCLCPDALAGEVLQQKTTDQGREKSQLLDIQGQEGYEE